MNKTNSISITKEEISGMEQEMFQGRIIVIQTLNEADKAVDYLSGFKVLGFDTETRPSFKKGHTHRVALIQISTEDTCFLFRINIIGFTESLKGLLNNDKITKIGLSIHDDFTMLNRVSSFEPRNFIELQSFVKQYNICDMSLQKIYAIIFGKKISKSQRLSNWEAENLTPGQQKYAATDAWACIQIYKKLKSDSIPVPNISDINRTNII
ncbi:3'-5' exonuclease [Coprobacter tertius]|uniref:3'-5' exonuclease n=1 Tax=Coprobacter tertius TaxID=2944915 RepID=A0ABT1MH26_9BACT|nr:3'-5' exonuclease [Coprobacter tertius]MCP9611932.1 3'-5' exonuclease domain-containing protein 2 [Coprobacter tertius]